MAVNYAYYSEPTWTGSVEWLLMNGLVAAAFVYTLMFNFLDEGLRTSIAGLLGLLIVGRCLLLWSEPRARAATLVFISLALLIGFYYIFMMDTRDDPDNVYVKQSFRLMVGFGILLAFSFSKRVISPALLIVMSVAVTLAGTFVALTGDPILYAEILRPAVFTGGKDGVHSTAYALTAAFLGVLALWQMRWISTFVVAALGPPLLVLLVLYNVRTCILMVLSYLFAATIIRLKEIVKSGHWVMVPVLGVLLAVILAMSANLVDYSSFSSGRSDAYSERLEVIASREPINLFFGTGVGSEMMTSTVWWWEKKNSHNDFIDIAIELGLVGLTLLIAMLCLVARNLDRYQLPLFFSFVISSAVSNGLIGRPFLALLLVAFMGLAARQTEPLGA